jgi:plastocyanin
MTRLHPWTALAGVGAAVAILASARTAAQGDKKWVTIKGQVVWPAARAIPKRQVINDSLLIDPKSQGVKNVWVYLAKGDISPDAKRFVPKKFDAAEIAPGLTNPAPKEHVVDQPVRQFVPRVLAAREGDTIVFKNSAPIPHNVRFAPDDDQDAFNLILWPGGQHKPARPLKAQRAPITFVDDSHPRMEGAMMVFDHPYFAVTDGDGKFEIKNAPAGQYRVFYRHELGFHKGRDGASGFPVAIQGANGTMEMKPVEIELP